MPTTITHNAMPAQPAKAPEHNPQPQPNMAAEMARYIEACCGALPPLQK